MKIVVDKNLVESVNEGDTTVFFDQVTKHQPNGDHTLVFEPAIPIPPGCRLRFRVGIASDGELYVYGLEMKKPWHRWRMLEHALPIVKGEPMD